MNDTAQTIFRTTNAIILFRKHDPPQRTGLNGERTAPRPQDRWSIHYLSHDGYGQNMALYYTSEEVRDSDYNRLIEAIQNGR